MIKLCPEVRVCWFGSSPRFGDEVMEIGVARPGQKCGIGEECGIWGDGSVWWMEIGGFPA